jgi:tetratricopeptide (TPR) repeat protein
LIKGYIVILFLIAGITVKGQTFPDQQIHTKLTRGINNLVNQDYASAKKVFNLLKDERPELPLGNIYIAAAYIAEAYDYGKEYNEAVIEENLSAARDKVKALVRKEGQNIWNKYYLALTEAYYSYYKALTGTWLTAITDGMDAVSAFEDCIKIDPSFYEAFIAVGAYKYWRSRKMEFINWIPFVKDEKQVGIELLESSMKYASYNSYLASSTLMWIYIDQKEFEKAVTVADKALKDFPENRAFKWGKGRAYEEINKGGAIEIYREILNSFPKGEETLVKEIWLKHLMAQQYMKSGNKREALLLCDEIIAEEKKLNKYGKNKLEERLKRVKEMRELLLAG